jgi:hypothetical protein
MNGDDLILHVHVDMGASGRAGGTRRVSGPIERLAARRHGITGGKARTAMRMASSVARLVGGGRLLGFLVRTHPIMLALTAMSIAAIIIARGETGRSFSNMGYLLRDRVLGKRVADLAAEIMAASDVAARPMLMQKIGREGAGGPGYRQALEFYDWRFRHNQVLQRGIYAIMMDPALQTNSIVDVIALKIYDFIAPAWNALKKAARSAFG